MGDHSVAIAQISRDRDVHGNRASCSLPSHPPSGFDIFAHRGVRAGCFGSAHEECTQFAEGLGGDMPEMVRFVIWCGCGRGREEERFALTNGAVSFGWGESLPRET
jgi:hypothetical protein